MIRFPTQSEERDILTLKVNVTSDSAKYIMRNLNWYYNGSLLRNSSNIIISDSNKTLTVTDGTAGEYEVRYDGLLLNNPYNEICEQMILNYLRHHPLFKPVKFLVNTKGTNTLVFTAKVIHSLNYIAEVTQASKINILFNGRIESVIAFTSGDNFTLKAVGQLATSIKPSEVDIVWYVNGLPKGLSNYHAQSGSTDYRRILSTFRYDGIYEALLVWNVNQECSTYYRQLSSNSVILARSSIEMKYYGKW